MKFETSLGTEQEPRTFAWRDYLKNPANMSETSSALLDALVGMLKTDSDASQFFDGLDKGYYKGHPVLSLVQFFKPALTQEELKNIFEEIDKCGPSGFKFER